MQAVGGAFQVVGGTVFAVATAETGIGIFIGVATATKGWDNFGTGLDQMFEGQPTQTLTYQAVESLTGSSGWATAANIGTDFTLPAYEGINALRASMALPGELEGALAPATNVVSIGETDSFVAAHFDSAGQLQPLYDASGLQGWWRNLQVQRAAAQFGYDPNLVRYVDEIGQILGRNARALGGLYNYETGEILIDRFAFDSEFLEGLGLPNPRAAVAHEIGHSYVIPGETTINPANLREFWANMNAYLYVPGQTQEEANALLSFAYRRYR